MLLSIGTSWPHLLAMASNLHNKCPGSRLFTLCEALLSAWSLGASDFKATCEIGFVTSSVLHPPRAREKAPSSVHVTSIQTNIPLHIARAVHIHTLAFM